MDQRPAKTVNTGTIKRHLCKAKPSARSPQQRTNQVLKSLRFAKDTNWSEERCRNILWTARLLSLDPQNNKFKPQCSQCTIQ